MNQQPPVPPEGSPQANMPESSPPVFAPAGPPPAPPEGPYGVPAAWPPFPAQPSYIPPPAYAPPQPPQAAWGYNPYPPMPGVPASRPPLPIPPEPVPEFTMAPPSVDRPEKPRSSGAARVLLFCAAAALAALVLVSVSLSALGGVAFERAPNGALTVYIGRQEVPQFTPAPVPSPDPVNSQSPAVTEQTPGPGTLTAQEVYSRVSPGVVGIVASGVYGSSTGTGMVIQENGYILTNEHVVSSMSNILAVFPDGSEHTAKLIGSDYLSDIAVLKVELSGLSTVSFGSSNSIVPGDPCYAIGNPLGMELQNTFTNGIVSAIGRDITLNDQNGRGDITMTVMQTNCAVNPGNSGGPLINERGEVIGIVSSKIMGDYYSTVEGLSFAIPMDSAVPIINSLLEYGRVRGRPMIGIIADTSNQLTKAQSDAIGVPYGVLIGDVTEGTDAYRQGVRAKDIVTHVEDIPVSTVSEINAIKNQFSAGDVLRMTVYQHTTGEIRELSIILGEAN